MTTVMLHPSQLPGRLQALNWQRPVYLRGEPLTEGPAIAIVGARAASTTAMARAHSWARHLAGRGVHVVSGGALGIDGAAHRGALAGGGTTTVVLGSGCDVWYPARHAPLFSEVLAQRGTLVSLCPDGTQPHRGTFPARNPLIAALADVVIVVEADVNSGSLTTAAAARKLGRIVVACPGSRGCERLLAAGVSIIEQAGDAELALAGTPRRRPVEPPIPQTAHDHDARLIREAIASGAEGIDEIVQRTGLTVRAVLRALPTIERKQ